MNVLSKFAIDENKRKRDPESSGDEQHNTRRFYPDPARPDLNRTRHAHAGSHLQDTSVDPTAPDLSNGTRRPDSERQSAYFVPKRTATNISSSSSSGDEATARYELAGDWYICLHKHCAFKPEWFVTLQAFYNHDTQCHKQPLKIAEPATPHRHGPGCHHAHEQPGTYSNGGGSHEATFESTASPAEDAKLIQLTRELFKVRPQKLVVDGRTIIRWWCACEGCRGSRKGYFDSEPFARKHQRCHIPQEYLPRKCDHEVNGQICGERFLYKSALAEHQKRWHLGVLYYCHNCRKYSSNRTDNLTRHWRSCTRSRTVPDIQEALIQPVNFQAPARKPKRQSQPGTSARAPARQRPAQTLPASPSTPTPQPRTRAPPSPAGYPPARQPANNMPPAPTGVLTRPSNRWDSLSHIQQYAPMPVNLIDPALLQPSAMAPPPVPVPQSPLAHAQPPIYYSYNEARGASHTSYDDDRTYSSSQSRAPSDGFSSAPRSRHSTKATSESSYTTEGRSYSDAVQNRPRKLAFRPGPVDRQTHGFGKPAPA